MLKRFRQSGRGASDSDGHLLRILFIFLAAFVGIHFVGLSPGNASLASGEEGALSTGHTDPVSSDPNENTWIVDGAVRVVVTTGTTTYIGGDFTNVGPNTGQGVSFVRSTGSLQLPYLKINGKVRAAAPDGSGGWYIGGNFTKVGRVPRYYIAHILPDGTLDHSWNPNANSYVYTLAVSGSTVYAGGSFSNIGGQGRYFIAALDSTGAATTWNPNANGTVYTLAVSGSTVYAGGNFSNIGGKDRNYIAALDSTGAATTWNPNANYGVNALAVSGSTVYAGGGFTSIGGQNRNYIAALDSTGAATTWNPNADNSVDVLAVNGSTVYAGGYFSRIGGQVRSFIAAIDSTGAATAWNPRANGNISALAVSGSTVYAGGGFTNIGAQDRRYIATLDSTTGAATAWNPNPNNYVSVIALSSSTVFVGGDFTSTAGRTRYHIAALDSTGAATAWNPNANGTVYTLAVSGSTVYAGGIFSNIGGQGRAYIAALDSTGAATAWNPNANGTVYTLAVSGSTVYAGGTFLNIGGKGRNNIAALDSTGAATTWNPDANNGVYALAVSGSTVYAGGYFSNIGGQTRNNIAALDSTGAATTWNPNADNSVYTLAVSGSTVYAGGSFSIIGGRNRYYLAAIDKTTGISTGWVPQPNGTITTIAVDASTVYAGGFFGNIGGEDRNYAAALDIVTGETASWDPCPNSAVNAIAVNGSRVYIGGSFDNLKSGKQPYFAQFDGYTVSASVSGGNGTVSPASQMVTYDTKAVVTVTPATGYSVATITGCGGTLSGTTYTTAPVTGSCDIVATFAINTFTVTSSVSGGHGTAYPSVQKVSYGAFASVYFSPDTGYALAAITDNGVRKTLANPYTVANVTAARAIVAVFSQKSYTVSASVSGGNGSVSPASQTVAAGGSGTITITPDKGYQIASITDNGTVVAKSPLRGAGQQYVVTNVQANHSIVVTFAAGSFTVTPQAGANGSLAPSTPQTVNINATTSFTVTASTGYQINSVTGCGGTLTGTTYTTGPVTSDCTVAATFTPNTFAVNASVSGGNGTAYPAAQTIANGGSASVYFTPATGYALATITDNGVSKTAANPYTVTNVTAAHAIVATFTQNTFAVNASVSGGNGTAYPAAQTITKGGSASVYFTPTTGYAIATITDNGVAQTVANPYTVTNVTAAHAVVATFSRKTFGVTASVSGGHGTVSPASQSVTAGNNAAITITPDLGYHVASITDNATVVAKSPLRGASQQYVVANVQAGHSIVVTFEVDSFTVAASVSGGHGTVTPSTQSVVPGGSATITITPDTGYHIASITDSTASSAKPTARGAGYQYVIQNVKANHTVVVVVFAPDTFTVAASVSGGNGTVSPASQNPAFGQTAAITITPAAGYRISAITDNGLTAPIANPYVVTNVSYNHTVVVSFALPTKALVSPGTVDFGAVAAKKTVTKTVTVRNAGGLPLVPGAARITGSTSFSISSNTCLYRTVSPGGTCTFTIAFTPVTTAPATASLAIPSNDPATPVFNVPLSGNTGSTKAEDD